MSRSCLTALLLAAYLAGQMAVGSHVHARQANGNESPLHVHLSGAAKHSHDHDDAEDRHAHDDGLGMPHENSPAEHDGGCVYLPDSITATIQGKVVISPVDLSLSPRDCLLVASGSLPPWRATLSVAPPEPMPSGIDLCLLLRTLRI